MQRTIMCVVGTRPEAIKMAPVILALKNESWAKVRVLATAQHREMLDQVLNLFDIEADVDLDIMRPNQALSSLTAKLLLKIDDVLEAEEPDAVLIQGDTTSIMTLALACFYRRIPVGHVEAGLRTGNIRNPFPEEANRVIASRLVQWHFAPTESSRSNLLREGVSETDITVTGNTVIDALMLMAENSPDLEVGLESQPAYHTGDVPSQGELRGPFSRDLQSVTDTCKAESGHRGPLSCASKPQCQSNSS